MKRTFLVNALLVICTLLFAQQPVITFEKTSHDFGKINEADGRVTTIFTFKNEGMAPLVLSNVRASCGCTTPTWTKTPVEPGQTGNITVTYNPNGRPGRFQKTITVTSNASEPTVKLSIKGEVIPKQQQGVIKYPTKMGDALAATTNVLVYGNVLNTGNITKTIEYTNNSDQEIKVELLLNENEPWIDAQATLVTVKPKEVGQIHVNVDGTKSKVWGMKNSYIYVMVNGKRQLTDEYKITLSYSIEEDFSKVDKKNAPILEIASKEINLGTVAAGSKVTKNIALKNAGVDPLIIRAINNTTPDKLKVTAPKNQIKNGKSQDVKVQVIAGQEVGTFRRQIDIVTNDPSMPHTRVTIVWTVK